jgi:hypothetical protein
MAETPILHLHLGTDEQVNRNWEILDDVMHRLARGVQIPDDLSILGSLDVRDNLTVGGLTTLNGLLNAAGGIETPLAVMTNAEVMEGLVIHGGIAGALTVENGTVSFPDQSLDGSDFKKGASVQSVNVSTPNINLTAIPVAPGAVLNALTVTDEDDRFELVLAQTSLQIGLAADAVCNGSVSYTLKRGSDASGVSVQTRAFQYAFTRAQTLTFPITIVRVGAPPLADTRRWSLVATASTAPTPATLTQTFTQIHCIQFR